MSDIIGIYICLSAILICSVVAFLSYNLGVKSQKNIDEYKNNMDKEEYYIKGYKSGYKQGCSDTNNELDRKNMQHAVINSRKK